MRNRQRLLTPPRPANTDLRPMPTRGERTRRRSHSTTTSSTKGAGSVKPKLLDLAACEGAASLGYMRAGFHVTAVDIDRAALRRNLADVKVQADGLTYLEQHGHEFDVIHASWPCQRWAANGVEKNRQWPDLITPGRHIVQDLGLPYVFENVPKAPLRRDLILCGTMFNLTTTDTDGTRLHLQRHRVFESNIPLSAPRPCVHPRGVQWAGVYGGARNDKTEARTIRKGGYVPPDAGVQSALLGGVPWMTGKGRRECIPPAYAEWIGRQLIAAVTRKEQEA